MARRGGMSAGRGPNLRWPLNGPLQFRHPHAAAGRQRQHARALLLGAQRAWRHAAEPADAHAGAHHGLLVLLRRCRCRAHHERLRAPLLLHLRLSRLLARRRRVVERRLGRRRLLRALLLLQQRLQPAADACDCMTGEGDSSGAWRESDDGRAHFTRNRHPVLRTFVVLTHRLRATNRVVKKKRILGGREISVPAPARRLGDGEG